MPAKDHEDESIRSRSLVNDNRSQEPNLASQNQPKQPSPSKDSNQETGISSKEGSSSAGSTTPLPIAPGSLRRESVLSQSLKRSKFSPHSALEPASKPTSLAPLVSNLPFRSPRPSVSVDAENPDPATVDIISRHLVGESELGSENEATESASADDEFDSLQLQGGDITREIYNWKRDHSRTPRRVKSFGSILRTGSFSSMSNLQGAAPSLQAGLEGAGNYGAFSEPDFNMSDIRVPGGFRRSFLAQRQAQHGLNPQKPTFFTRNFIEFLSLYGHFAGEELSDEDDGDESMYDDEALVGSGSERERLLRGGRKHPHRHEEAQASTFKAVLLLLKAFIGTGILFLPKAFYNGGILFCLVTLLFFSTLSYWCFLLLIDVRVKTQVDSFGDIGKLYFGEKMRILILTSIVMAQIGFAAAYIVFVAQNLKSVAIALLGKDVTISFLIFSQLVIFIPLSLTRKIAKLSGTALVADFFILLGIIYIYYNCSFEIVENGFKQVELFNPNSWTLFIGTAVFTYEGIGLLIPIQKSMKEPQKFSGCLGGVMVGITLVFVSIGAICYLAYGADVQTVILNNFPQNNRSVNVIQLLYSLAILLSTPLQLFPAIRILENGIFGTHRSGKYNLKVKWRKNFFRITLIIITSLISWVGNSDLDKFVALIGSFACIPLIYIYPPLLHIKSFIEEMSTGNTFPASRNYVLNNYVACYGNVLVTIFGVLLMLYTSLDALKSWLA